MITKKQQRWINHLSNTKKVKILPHDHDCKEKFLKIKKQINDSLGKEIKVLHRGASALGISGQDEIDVYIPVGPEKFDILTPKLSKLFGKPGSIYPLERIRFNVKIDGKKIDLFLINKNANGWIASEKFESHLRKNKKALEEYKKIKEDANGLSVREYYRRKIEFINTILNRVLPQSKPAVFALIFWGSKILLTLRDDKSTIPYPDCWHLPGGIIEKGESPTQAIKRELEEEVTHIPRNLKYLGRFKKDNGKLAYTFISKVGSNEARSFKFTKNEGQKIKFFNIKEISKLKVSNTLQDRLDRYGYIFNAMLK